MADAADAAYDVQAYDVAREMFDRHAAIRPLPPSLLNLKGLIALSEQRFAEAATVFETIRQAGEDNAVLRFNLAWARAKIADYPAALALLDDEAISVTPRGPALKIHVMHHLNMYDEALECGAILAARFPDNEPLHGALATLALDADRIDLAAQYAKRASGDPEGHTALGYLSLVESDARTSLELFERSLQSQTENPRAWLGKGLSLLLAGQSAAAAEAIDRGATQFGTHLGSWIASGWAHFLANDRTGARHSFERARSLDPNFSEAHGGLAVLDIAEGQFESGKHNTEVALRLDRNSLGAALAKSLLLKASGQTDHAQRVLQTAISLPVGPSGQTIAAALVALNARRGGSVH